MNTNSLHFHGFTLVLSAIVLLSGGCATTSKYSAERYKPAQDRYGAISLHTAKKFYLCPTIDSVVPECRKLLDPSFTPWTYATDAIEQELKVSSVNPIRPEFTFGPSFDSIKQVIAEKANKSENAVYLGTELLWLTGSQWTIDAKLYAPTGDLLFEKRGICIVLGVTTNDAQEVTHMAIRQIIADPKFEQVLQ